MELKDIIVGRMYRFECPKGSAKRFKDYIVKSIDEESEEIVCESKEGNEQTVLCAAELEPLPYTTVADLMDQLKKFDPNTGVDLSISWYHGRNFCHAHKKSWARDLDKGTRLYVEDCDGTVEIKNDRTEDYDMDED